MARLKNYKRHLLVSRHKCGGIIIRFKYYADMETIFVPADIVKTMQSIKNFLVQNYNIDDDAGFSYCPHVRSLLRDRNFYRKLAEAFLES